MSYIITYYLPSGLFVVVSWISFLIPPDIVPGKYNQTVQQGFRTSGNPRIWNFPNPNIFLSLSWLLQSSPSTSLHWSALFFFGLLKFSARVFGGCWGLQESVGVCRSLLGSARGLLGSAGAFRGLLGSTGVYLGLLGSARVCQGLPKSLGCAWVFIWNFWGDLICPGLPRSSLFCQVWSVQLELIQMFL